VGAEGSGEGEPERDRDRGRGRGGEREREKRMNYTIYPSTVLIRDPQFPFLKEEHLFQGKA